jgi:hypothetical protein
LADEEEGEGGGGVVSFVRLVEVEGASVALI